MHAVSHLASKDPQSNASPQVALIAEGGGQRGIFTAGVLDAWLDGGFDPFDLFIGTSAGSQNLSSFWPAKGVCQTLNPRFIAP